MILDVFAGCGGWSLGLAALGLAEVGVELDRYACQTRAAAGFATIRADVATFPAAHLAGRVDGLIASPPCQDHSVAGPRAGRATARGRLVDVVPELVETLRPRWVACEQVPPVLAIWHEHAARYRAAGYATWVGILNAADYGVPQTRRRAFLLARRDGPALPPSPTHTARSTMTLFGDLGAWVPMATALGWQGATHDTHRHRPAPTVTGRFPDRQRLVLDRRAGYLDGAPTRPVVDTSTTPAPTVTGTALAHSVWQLRPATTVVGSFRPDIIAAPGWRTDVSRQDAPGSVRITLADALTLQGFPPDYPLRGPRSAQFLQVGNAVPPPVATAVLAQLVGGAAP